MGNAKQKPRLRAPSREQLDAEFAFFFPAEAARRGIPPPPPEFIARMRKDGERPCEELSS